MRILYFNRYFRCVCHVSSRAVLIVLDLLSLVIILSSQIVHNDHLNNHLHHF